MLKRHPDVDDAAVIGVPDDERGQSAMAFVVPAGCVERSDTFEHELRAHCEREMAGFKQPRAFEFRDERPYSPAGKLLRRELREPFWA